MFARRLALDLRNAAGEDRPVPKPWLDQFFMRNFTGKATFDETLPVADGEMEVGLEVSPEAVRAEFEQWLRGRKMIPPDTALQVRVKAAC